MDEKLVMQWLSREDVALQTVSYAQNHEDILLARALPHRGGLYVDVGANHPIFHSVTKLFADRDWQGINIEPSPLVFERLAEDRPNQVNLNIGVGDVSGTLTFFETPDRHGWSSFRTELAEHYRGLGVAVVERPVPVLTLAEVCERHVGDRTIDFLKIDAEGFERHVLLGADFGRWRPRVLMIENAWPTVWEMLVEAAHYKFAAFDGLNRYYVRAEEPELLAAFEAPVNVLDSYVSNEYVRLLEREVAAARADQARIDAEVLAARIAEVRAEAQAAIAAAAAPQAVPFASAAAGHNAGGTRGFVAKALRSVARRVDGRQAG